MKSQRFECFGSLYGNVVKNNTFLHQNSNQKIDSQTEEEIATAEEQPISNRFHS
jgi:hypothetical protein